MSDSTVVSGASMGVVKVSSSGEIHAVAGSGSIFTHATTELAGRSAFELWADLPAVIEVVRRALDGEEVAAELEIAGSWWELRGAPERDASGDRGAVLVVIDQTARRLAADQARRDLSFLDSLIENLPDMVFVKRAEDLRFIRFNRAGETLLGYRRDEMIGKNDHDFFPAEEADRFTGNDRAVLETGQLVDTPEEPIHTRYRGTRLLHTKKIPIYDAAGTPIYLLGIAEDITDQRQIEAERRELERLRTELVANVSHEFRTPLTLILAHLSRLLEREAIPDTDRARLAAITRGVHGVLALVDDLLDLARREAGKLTANYADVDLGQLVRQIAGSFDVLATSKAVDLVIDAPALPAQVDPGQIQRVITNLVANAIRHAPRGGRVRCVVQRTDHHARVSVADSGPGIPIDQRERVFERFFQVPGDPQRAGGVGLGLALVRDLVELHGGKVAVRDAAEGGAELVVELPLTAPRDAIVRARTKTGAGLVPVPAAAPVPRRPPRTEGPLILVVEDHPDFNRMLVDTIEEKYRVASAFDGEEGLARAIELVPDLIVTDLMMPRMTGERLIEAIRANPALDAVPIIVLTAKADDALRLRLLRHGAQDYVMKPFLVDELMARIDNLISLKRARDVLRGELASTRDDVVDLASDLARRNRHARFLADASAILARSLDYQTTLAEVGKLAVPDIADACAIDIVEPDDKLNRVVTTSIDTAASTLLEHPDRAIVVQLVARDRHIGSLTLAWASAARRHDEAELALANELAGRAALAIDNARLYLDARTAIGLRDEFLSIASHELRTPLTPLVIAVQTLAEAFRDDDSPLRRKLVETVVRQAERLTVLVDELLDATRIDAGALSIHREELDLGELAESVLARWAPQLSRAGCATSLRRTGPVVGRWDKLRLEQVLANLLSNAVKFAAGKPIEVAVESVGDRARLAVRDHGIGIEPARQREIFARFVRAVPARHYGGLGLGLYISSKIVEAHDGSLSVESAPGAGSTFVMELPR